jgi:hypothetical protein
MGEFDRHDQPRRVSIMLGLGILLMPYVFAWLTLRRGYSTSTKILSFAWLAIVGTVAIFSRFPSVEQQSSAANRHDDATIAMSCPVAPDIGGPVSQAKKFVVKFVAAARGEPRKPTIVGRTNLPAGTKLIISLEREASAYKAQAETTVGNDGCFSGGPFTQNREPINPGDYTIDVLMPLSSGQPQPVQSIIGDRGQNIAGPLVSPFPKQPHRSLGKISEYRTTFTAGAADKQTDADAKRKAEDDRKTRISDMRWAAALTAVRTLKANLKNPSSADWVSVYTNDDGNVVCVALRAQNGFGGMSVERYASVGQEIKEDTATWNKRCAGDGFYDYTRLIRQIE